MKQIEHGNRRNVAIYLILICFFRVLLDISYAESISVEYSYLGFYNNYSFENALCSWTVLILMSRLSFHNYINAKNKLSCEIVFWLFLFSFVPFTSLICYGAYSVQFIIFNIIYWLMLIIFSNDFTVKNRARITISNIHVINDAHIIALAIVSFLIVIYVSGRYTGFRLNFNLLSVYDLRNEAQTYNLPTLLDYAFSWTRTVNSIFVAYFIRKKKWAWALSCFLIQMLNFGVDGSKTTFFLAIFAIIINFTPPFRLGRINKWVLGGFSAVVLFCHMFYTMAGNIIPAAIITRRVFFVPAIIQKNYFDFFSTHTPDFFRQSFLRHFGFTSPYPNISYMVGNIYSNQSNLNANNGLISDAITNLGYAGIILMPILLILVLKMLDKASDGLDIRLYITVALYTSIVLTNSFLLTVLVTHGLLIVMLLLKFMNRDEDLSRSRMMEN